MGQGCPILRQASAEKTGYKQALAGEETSRAPSPFFRPQPKAMAPGPGFHASLALHRPRARAAPDDRAPDCAVPGTVLLLLAYLAYLALGTGVFWVLESPAARDSSARFQRDKWALLQNFTCLDGPALDSLIRVRRERGHGGGREGTPRLRSEAGVWGLDAGRLGRAEGGSLGLHRRGPGSGAAGGKRTSAPSLALGQRGHYPPGPDGCWAQIPEFEHRDYRGRT